MYKAIRVRVFLCFFEYFSIFWVAPSRSSVAPCFFRLPVVILLPPDTFFGCPDPFFYCPVFLGVAPCHSFIALNSLQKSTGFCTQTAGERDGSLWKNLRQVVLNNFIFCELQRRILYSLRHKSHKFFHQ